MTANIPTAEPTGLSRFADGVRRDGFGVVCGAVDQPDAERMRNALSRMLPYGPTAPPPLERQVPRIVEAHPDFTALATNPALISMLRELFGAIPQLVCSYGHEKPAHTGAHTAVHSDVAHLRGVPHHESLLMVKVMYALTRVGPKSGGTLVYPSSHRLPVADQKMSADQDGHRILLDSGDLQLFHANLLHSGTANPSDEPRLSVWYVFAQPWMRAFPGHEHSAAFLETLRPRLEADPTLAAVFGLRSPYATSG